MRDLMPIIQELAALPEGAANGEAPLDVEDVGRILDAHGVTYLEFEVLDNAPGRYGYCACLPRGWHWKLRRWRNSGALRSHVFAGR